VVGWYLSKKGFGISVKKGFGISAEKGFGISVKWIWYLSKK
jgi:hypothetical protein